ncbi:ribonuclease Y [Blastopirellula marina]|uniref:Ribonuclease Y n=1 Tax=Blastopirellula marina TaxID=124 RepID=A0A2S8G981_9BACT|nr:ribonuclease Y [Blastopirellula marina]PQO40979.1 ribonuclease Y [Blastopirellula marina]PTL45862.1 ribonuclease Y [Blastopirellula marina]
MGSGWYIALTAVIAAVGSALLVKFIDRLRKKDVETEATQILDKAKQDSENLKKEALLEAKEEALKQKTHAEKELSKQRDEIREREKSLDRREESLEQQATHLRKQENMVEKNQRRLAEKIDENEKRSTTLENIIRDQQERLHRMSGLNAEEAKSELLKLLDQQLQSETGAIILKHQRRMEDEVRPIAQDMLLTAMQRFAAAHTAESTTSTVDIPSDEMKGRIIGREGRNIRSFEKETGVDVIIDDTPGVVIVSGFDPVRREIARQALNKLIADGRIHPSRIEEVVKETQSEIETTIRKKGEEAATEINVMGLQPRLIEMLGRLHFRTSYSQNVLRHSIEVGFIAGLLAEMIGLDPQIARRAGLLHDIGKAADHELEGGHPKIGADLLKRHGESPEVVHAAFGHHDEIITEYPYTMLVATADACSASRPGARRETLERYIKRMEELEAIATGFHGVEQAFAIQAGRELRVIASAKEVNDEMAAKICRDIAKAFEQQLTYPGEIKVTMVRESRFTEFAR